MASIRTSLSFFQFASRSENFRPRGEREKGAVLARMLMSDWQVIFLQSKANGGAYDGERFPGQKWDWPRSTWFQNRLRYLRKSQQPVVLRKTTTGLELA